MNEAQKIIKVFAICLAIVIIFNIFTAIISVFTSIFDLDFDTREKKEFNQVYENIKKIKIESVTANITIKEGDSFEVLATNMKSKFSCNVENEILKIEEHNKIFFNNSGGNIVVYVPFNTRLDELDIENGAGKIKIGNILAKKIDLDQGAGKIEIEGSKFDKADIDGGAGKIEISSSVLNDLDFDAGVGEISLNGSITGNSKIDCGVGSINMYLENSKDEYSIIASKGLGSIKIDGINKDSDTTYGTGENKIKLEGGVGSINVNFSNI